MYHDFVAVPVGEEPDLLDSKTTSTLGRLLRIELANDEHRTVLLCGAVLPTWSGTWCWTGQTAFLV